MLAVGVVEEILPPELEALVVAGQGLLEILLELPLLELLIQVVEVVEPEDMKQQFLVVQAAQALLSLNTTHLHNPHLSIEVLAVG
jgi:hypothetical protein